MIIPVIGRTYLVVSGPYKDFIGKCVSYDLESDLPIILQDENFRGAACKLNEVKSLSPYKSGKTVMYPKSRKNY